MKINAWFLSVILAMSVSCKQNEPSREKTGVNSDNAPIRFGQIIKVKPEKLNYYKVLHADPWPGVIKQIEDAHLRNYSIFNLDTLLFAYVEYTGNDYEGDMAKIALDTTTQRWWKETDPCQESLSEDSSQWWLNMEQVFYALPPKSGKVVRKRFGQIIGVKPEKLAYYKKLHANPWPGVIKTLEKHNIQNYSIFHYKDYLFAYLEYTGDDYAADMKGIAADTTTQRWWKETDPCQFPVNGESDGWTDMEQVFYCCP